MSYIQSKIHFLNYIHKVIKQNPHLDENELLPDAAYIDFIYSRGLQDDYTYDLQTSPEILENEYLIQWLQAKTSHDIYIHNPYRHLFTPEFAQLLKDIPPNRAGIYSFWTLKEKPIYVGMSHDLKNRIPSSFRERFQHYKKEMLFKYILTDSACDAALLEVYYITLLKPALNSVAKYKDKLTMQINNSPDFNSPIQCNIVKR